MASTTGIAPLDPLTLVGQTRLTVGDVEYVPLVPAVDGQGSYSYFSDAQIEAFLAVGRNSIARATGHACRQLAAGAALTASAIKTDDLSHSTVTRAGDLLKVAQAWFDTADDEDALANGDIFEVVQTGTDADPYGNYGLDTRRVRVL